MAYLGLTVEFCGSIYLQSLSLPIYIYFIYLSIDLFHSISTYLSIYLFLNLSNRMYISVCVCIFVLMSVWVWECVSVSVAWVCRVYVCVRVYVRCCVSWMYLSSYIYSFILFMRACVCAQWLYTVYIDLSRWGTHCTLRYFSRTRTQTFASDASCWMQKLNWVSSVFSSFFFSCAHFDS